jgi:hypothetical protein
VLVVTAIDKSEVYFACAYQRKCPILQKNYFYLLLICLGPKCVYIEAVDGHSLLVLLDVLTVSRCLPALSPRKKMGPDTESC